MDETCAHLFREPQQDQRAEHVRADELLGSEDGPVDVRLGGEVHDRIHRADLLDVLSYGNVPPPAVRPFGQVGGVSRVRELVQDDHVFAGGQHPLDEVRADEARAAGD